MQIQILFFLFVCLVSFVYLKGVFQVIGSPITNEAKHLFALRRAGLIQPRVLSKVRYLLPTGRYKVAIGLVVGVVGWKLLFWPLDFFHSIESVVGFFIFGLSWSFVMQAFFTSLHGGIEQLALAAYFSKGCGIAAEPIHIEDRHGVKVALYLTGPVIKETNEQCVSVLGKQRVIPGDKDVFGMSITVPLDVLRNLRR